MFSLYSYEDAAAAVEIANETTFGLGASVWCANDAAEREVFRQGIDAGMIFFNTMVASDARVPFGGTKHSGFGRELGEAGVREFALIKTIVE